MNKLEKKKLIKISKSDPYYFQTLLAKASAIGALDKYQVEGIQAQCLMLLASQTNAFTKGLSSSVKTEVAESILASITYTISVGLKQQDNADDALRLLEVQPIEDIFKQGNELIKKQVKDAKILYDYINNHRIMTENLAYNDTIQSGIKMFFDTYDPDFFAHETPGSIDYPLEVPTELCGIEYMSSYLQNLYIENSICSRYTDVDSLLRGYSNDFGELLINIYNIVLMNAIGCTLVNKTKTLHLDAIDRHFLQQQFLNLSEQQILNVLISTADKLCKNLNNISRNESVYIRASIPRMLPRLKNAIELHQLVTVFLSCKQPQLKQTAYIDHTKMNDERFRQITEEIRGYQNVEQKIAVIQQEVKSFADLVDVLEASCIWEEEYINVFTTLDESTLSMLMDIVRNKVDDLYLSENQKMWHNKFLQFIDSK